MRAKWAWIAMGTPNTVRDEGCHRQASSTLAVECLRKSGHEGNAQNASLDPRRSSASASA
jgi:hypothetical protein